MRPWRKEVDGLCNRSLCEGELQINSFTYRFLLEYTSRDQVGLFEKGCGGLPEVQEAVQKYQEQSPLFGFIQYRRRKVLLRYVPEGTSRLLQGI